MIFIIEKNGASIKSVESKQKAVDYITDNYCYPGDYIFIEGERLKLSLEVNNDR